jgi:hypothetical protein
MGLNLPAPEAFSFTLSSARTAPLTQSENDAVAAAAVSMFAQADSLISSAAILKEVKSAFLDPTGRYTAGERPVITHVDQAGSTGGAPNAPQVALVVSLGTANPKVRGRFYLPMPVVQLNRSDLLILGPIQELAADSYKAFVANVNLSLDPPPATAGHVCVNSKFGGGVNERVTQIRLGAAVDTMRSRRRSLKERYVVRPLP